MMIDGRSHHLKKKSLIISIYFSNMPTKDMLMSQVTGLLKMKILVPVP